MSDSEYPSAQCFRWAEKRGDTRIFEVGARGGEHAVQRRRAALALHHTVGASAQGRTNGQWRRAFTQSTLCVWNNNKNEQRAAAKTRLSRGALLDVKVKICHRVQDT